MRLSGEVTRTFYEIICFLLLMNGQCRHIINSLKCIYFFVRLLCFKLKPTNVLLTITKGQRKADAIFFLLKEENKLVL